MPKIQFYFLSWQKLHNICFQLTKKVIAQNQKFDRIVNISRGGAVVSRIFSDFLNLPMSNFSIASFVAIGKAGKLKIIEELAIDIKGQNILLIDEIVDTGKTLTKAVNYLTKLQPQKITTLAPFINSWAEPKPNFWQACKDKWIIFPYEINETINDTFKMWEKQGLSSARIKQKLIKIGIPKKQLTYFTPS